MGDRSGIEWTDATWNPIVGCSVVSPGCTNCYAMKRAARIEAMREGSWRKMLTPDTPTPPGGRYEGLTQDSNGGPVWTGQVALAPDDTLTIPLRWQRPRRIFVNSMGDLFHESVPDEWIDRVFAVMALAPQHVFQVLTKRSARMRDYLGAMTVDRVELAMDDLSLTDNQLREIVKVLLPLPNVHLGVSAEDQPRANERIPDLLATPAAVRFVSYEPALGPVNFRRLRGMLSPNASPRLTAIQTRWTKCSRCRKTPISRAGTPTPAARATA